MRSLCRNCIHDGQCDGLPNCGGRFYEEDTERAVSESDPWEGYDPDDERDARAEAWLERNEP